MTGFKACPPWAISMVDNFRRMYKATYEEETTLSDDQIFTICETVWDDSNLEQQDKDRVEAMRAMEIDNED